MIFERIINFCLLLVDIYIGLVGLSLRFLLVFILELLLNILFLKILLK